MLMKMYSFSFVQSDFEFQQKYSCVKPPDVSYNHTDIFRNKYKKLYQRPQNLTIPENVDWRSMGAVTSVKSQVTFYLYISIYLSMIFYLCTYL